VNTIGGSVIGLYLLQINKIISTLIIVVFHQSTYRVQNWNSADVTSNSDAYKMICAKKAGYTVIRIFQPDVWRDRNDWKTKLLAVIKEYKTP
jgi:hypothetical protein